VSGEIPPIPRDGSGTGESQSLNQMAERVVTVQAHAHRAAPRVEFDKLRLWRETEPAVEGRAQEPFHPVRIHPARVHMHLEVVALPGGIHAHRHRVVAKGPLEHGLGEIDKCKAAKEICAFQPVEVWWVFNGK